MTVCVRICPFRRAVTSKSWGWWGQMRATTSVWRRTTRATLRPPPSSSCRNPVSSSRRRPCRCRRAGRASCANAWALCHHRTTLSSTTVLCLYPLYCSISAPSSIASVHRCQHYDASMPSLIHHHAQTVPLTYPFHTIAWLALPLCYLGAIKCFSSSCPLRSHCWSVSHQCLHHPCKGATPYPTAPSTLSLAAGSTVGVKGHTQASSGSDGDRDCGGWGAQWRTRLALQQLMWREEEFGEARWGVLTSVCAVVV